MYMYMYMYVYMNIHVRVHEHTCTCTCMCTRIHVHVFPHSKGWEMARKKPCLNVRNRDWIFSQWSSAIHSSMGIECRHMYKSCICTLYMYCTCRCRCVYCTCILNRRLYTYMYTVRVIMWVTHLLFNKNAGTVDNNCFYALCNCMLYIRCMTR